MSSYKRMTNKELTDTIVNNDFETKYIECVKRLWEIENKIENGTLVELPCKVGQPIWIVCYELWTTKPFVDESFIKSFEQIARIMEHGEIGKSVFLTKAEAEAKLRELKGERQ